MPFGWRAVLLLACGLAAAQAHAQDLSVFDLPPPQDFQLSADQRAPQGTTVPDVDPLPNIEAPELDGNWQTADPIRFSMADDLRALPYTLWDDVKVVFRPKPVLILVGAGLGSLAIRETVDEKVAEDVLDHPNRWGYGSETLSILGNPGHHFALTGGLYVWSLYRQDAELHDFSSTMMNALLISNTTNYVLKLTARASTPNGEPHGWPSGHAESTMCVAAVVHEYYGWRAAVPMYTLAGAVSFARMDDGEHYLSDVVFGLFLGYVVGRTVARNHCQVGCGEIIVTADPGTGTQLLGWQTEY